jgi:protein pelota
MRILKLDEKHASVSIIPENEDDLWHLSKIIERGDIVSGLTSRKEKGKEGSATIRKTFFVELEVEKSTFDRFGKVLRVSGKIIGGSADMLPLGSMQVIEIEPNKKYKIVKKAFMKHHIERLKKATSARKQEILLVVLDDEHATIALLRDFKYEIRAELRSAKSGKLFETEQWRKEYFGNIAKKILDYNINSVIVAGPGFVKDEFAEFLREKGFKGRLFVEGTSTTGLTGINELIKGPAIAKIAREAQIVEESKLIEKLLEEIAKDGLATYGMEEVKKASELGAIETLLVLDKLLVENREEIVEIIETSEKAQAKVHIFNSEYEPGKKLESLGGIAALLRYKLTY